MRLRAPQQELLCSSPSRPSAASMRYQNGARWQGFAAPRKNQRALASSAPFLSEAISDGRLRREHKTGRLENGSAGPSNFAELDKHNYQSPVWSYSGRWIAYLRWKVVGRATERSIEIRAAAGGSSKTVHQKQACRI
jgi:hypothetical protein